MKVYETITQEFIDALSKGVIPWKKEWRNFTPSNLSTGKEYKGINRIILSMKGFSSPYWVGMKQCNALGGRIKKGAKASNIVKWWMEKEILEDGSERLVPKYPLILKVWNVEQTTGIEDKLPVVNTNNHPITPAEKVVNGMPNKPVIKHVDGTPCYNLITDEVHIPAIKAFINSDAYYVTLFHELVHSTLHTSRLNRRKEKNINQSNLQTYSQEELVAEIGASFLSSEAGISQDLENSKAYINGWVRFLENHKNAIIIAAQSAEKAANFIMNR